VRSDPAYPIRPAARAPHPRGSCRETARPTPPPSRRTGPPTAPIASAPAHARHPVDPHSDAPCDDHTQPAPPLRASCRSDRKSPRSPPPPPTSPEISFQKPPTHQRELLALAVPAPTHGRDSQPAGGKSGHQRGDHMAISGEKSGHLRELSMAADSRVPNPARLHCYYSVLTANRGEP
jgi:hypothetical protein